MKGTFRFSVFDFRLWACLCLMGLLAACHRGPEPVPPGEPYSIDAVLSADRIHIGDPVRLIIRARHRPDERVLIPDPSRNRAIIVRNRATDIRPIDENLAATTVTFDLTPFQVGQHLLPTGEVRFIAADRDDVIRPLPETNLVVVSALTDEDEALRDIRPVMTWPAAVPRWVIALGVTAVLALIAAVAAHRFLSKPRTILQAAPPVPPDEEAIRALRRLMSRQWIEQGHVEPFYVELSNIVRQYLEKRFHLRAPEQTTEEFIREASTSQGLSPEHRQRVQDFLTQADLVKFARYRPSAEDMKSAYGAAERLVMETRIHPGDSTS